MFLISHHNKRWLVFFTLDIQIYVHYNCKIERLFEHIKQFIVLAVHGLQSGYIQTHTDSEIPLCENFIVIVVNGLI